MAQTSVALLTAICLVAAALLGLAPTRADDEAWLSKIRPDHPRLFFNADRWPAVKERALTVEKDHYAKIKAHADGPPPKHEWSQIDRPAPLLGSDVEVRDWGDQLMSSAFVYRVEPTATRLADIKAKLRASVEYYHACYDQGMAVAWTGGSRIGAMCALDWLWDEFSYQERQEIGQGLLEHVRQALFKPGIERRAGVGSTPHRQSMYGVVSLALPAGLLFYNEGIDDEQALELLKFGYEVNTQMLAFRAEAALDDGGGASSCLPYQFGKYMQAEWNFMFLWGAATGENLASEWPYLALHPNYVMWNLLPGGHEFGYGSAYHIYGGGNNIDVMGWLYTHLSQYMHFFAESHPQMAALAHHLRDEIGGSFTSEFGSVYPFLLTGLEHAPPPQVPSGLPPARHFENMGQVFMRSGTGPDDTYAMFACGGIVDMHRHFDAIHFSIYKQGFLALDTGAREGNTDNVANYFNQTIAHNCVLFADRGQIKQVGSEVLAFETDPLFTYVAGDATAVYPQSTCELMVRQFVFIPPDHFLVCDRAVSTQAEYSKTWLLHHANEPALSGNTWHSDQDRGRIFCRTLLPEDAVLEKVGGPGKEFWVNGVNYPLDAGLSESMKKAGYDPEQFKKEYDEVPELAGRWRMEVKPRNPRKEDVFLHLIQVGDQTLQEMSETQVASDEAEVTVTFDALNKRVTLSFATVGAVGGHIRIQQGAEVLVDRDLTHEVMPQAGLALM